RPEAARPVAVVPASLRARAGSVARSRAAVALCRNESHVEGSNRSEGGAARAAAADKRLSPARSLYRRRRGGGPRVRHHRRADRAADVGDQVALSRALRSKPKSGLALTISAAPLPRPDGWRLSARSDRRAGASAKYFRAG